jgi:hypothetical protein
MDQEAFNNFKQAAHPPSLFSHKGYIQWQGSQAQKSLLEDTKNDMHINLTKNIYMSQNLSTVP